MAGAFGGLANPLPTQPTLTDIPDVELVSPPPESISTISFSPAADHLAVGSWGPDVSSLVIVTVDFTLSWEGEHGRAIWFLILFFRVMVFCDRWDI